MFYFNVFQRMRPLTATAILVHQGLEKARSNVYLNDVNEYVL